MTGKHTIRTAVCVAVVAALGAATTANAVVLNPHGTGQVLIYPYYTVNAGFGTLLSVVNTTNEGKALKVHVREGYNGRDVVAFNLYLSPFDAWVAQIFDTSADGTGAAAMATNDNSCTVPAFSTTFGPTPGVGPAVAPFNSRGFTGANADGGPTSLARTREGYVEIIEMGTVTNDQQHTLDAITHSSDAVPSNCAQLVQAWSGGGYWSTGNYNVDIAPPSGGLLGAESIINVGSGLLYTVNAPAIDGFGSVAQHALPADALPDLSSATKDGSGIVSAFVPVGGTSLRADFSRGEDAISALLMADALYNEYVVSPGTGAATDWVVTFPTKRFYTDAAIVGSVARPPFDAVFGADPDISCSPLDSRFFSREELTVSNGISFPEPPPTATTAACFATSVFTFGNVPSVLGSRLVRDLDNFLGYFSVVPVDEAGFAAGHAEFDLRRDSNHILQSNHVLAAAAGITFPGLPALGFAATNYVNGNASAGMLANYSGAYPHRSTLSCADAQTPQPGCGSGGTP